MPTIPLKKLQEVRCYACNRMLAKIDLQLGTLEIVCPGSKCGKTNTVNVAKKESESQSFSIRTLPE